MQSPRLGAFASTIIATTLLASGGCESAPSLVAPAPVVAPADVDGASGSEREARATRGIPAPVSSVQRLPSQRSLTAIDRDGSDTIEKGSPLKATPARTYPADAPDLDNPRAAPPAPKTEAKPKELWNGRHPQPAN